MDSLVEQELFGGAYNNKKVLITGITGFKGSWLAHWLKMMGANVCGIGLEPETTPNHFTLLNQHFHCVNILDTKKLNEVIKLEQPDIVFHLAAQALVRRSYNEPVDTYTTNVIGSLNVYNVCLAYPCIKGIVSITSDKVYENKEQMEPYKETDELGGYDLYSSSKACMEIMTSSFVRSYSERLTFPIVTARAGNVIGGGDWAADRLIPDLVRAAGKNNSVVIRYPEAVRPWQHVLEPLSGYLVLGEKLLSSTSNIQGAWNFGPLNQKHITVREILQMAKKYWSSIQYEVALESDKPHEAGILAVDSHKAFQLLNWSPVWNTERALEKTIMWYKSYMNDKVVNTTEDIIQYVKEAQCKKLNWTNE